MIITLYENYRHWSDGRSVYILSDPHFDDAIGKDMVDEWLEADELVDKINSIVGKNDTFICLGDVGKAEYVRKIKAKYKVLLLGNHDRRSDYVGLFDEIYTGPLFIADQILLSHEPVQGLNWCLNIHGHDHNNRAPYVEGCKHINLAANVCNYTPVNLGKLIKSGVLADITNIHRMTIDRASDRKAGQQQGLQALMEADCIAEDDRDFVERYIPSPEVKELIKKENIEFSDANRATIIFNSGLTLFELHRELKKIADNTADDRLREQIGERIAYDLNALKLFTDDRGGYVYQLFIGNESYGDGFFSNVKPAIEMGKAVKKEFSIEKHQIISDPENVRPMKVIDTAWIEPEPSNRVHRHIMPGAPLAGIRFDKKGLITDYYSCERSDEEDIRIEGCSAERFEYSYVVIPNPYEKGDRVRFVDDKGKAGIVDVSQEDWRRHVEKALKPGAREDYSDASITVRYPEWEYDHDHINPIYLEKVYEERK
ncbi:MAG: hypothetical protein K5754_00350 [Butyrivibrio sp.]|nr:hypothetical protein [Butyrivibrio sp.]